MSLTMLFIKKGKFSIKLCNSDIKFMITKKAILVRRLLHWAFFQPIIIHWKEAQAYRGSFSGQMMGVTPIIIVVGLIPIHANIVCLALWPQLLQDILRLLTVCTSKRLYLSNDLILLQLHVNDGLLEMWDSLHHFWFLLFQLLQLDLQVWLLNNEWGH